MFLPYWTKQYLILEYYFVAVLLQLYLLSAWTQLQEVTQANKNKEVYVQKKQQ